MDSLRGLTQSRFISWQWILVLALLAGLTAVMVDVLPPAVDWQESFRPAALELLAGRSPYSVESYYNAPWTLLPLIPFALLPLELSRALLVVVSLAGFGWTAYRMGARPAVMFLLLASPPVIHCLLNGNVEWMVVPAFVLPPWLGLFLIAIKPQVGFVLAIYWLFEAWREGGLRKVVVTFAPVTVALLLSFLIFGLWPLRLETRLDTTHYSFWPASLPVGLALLAYAVRKRKINYIYGASPLLAPHALLHSWVGGLYSLINSWPEMLAAVGGLWIVVYLLR